MKREAVKREVVKSQHRTTQRHTAPHSATQRHTAPHIRRLPSFSSHLVRADKAPYGAGEGGGVVCLGRGERRK